MNVKPKGKSRFGRWGICCGGCGLLLVAAVVLVVVPPPLMYFVVAPREHAAIAATYPAPGQIFEVDGSKMHIYCEGQGSRAVIVISGEVNPSLEWRDVQAKLAGDARVCIYDRLGWGWSGTTSRARTPENIADELSGLVTAAGIAPGFVLVGDEAGSIYARMFAWRHPGQAGALLLLDIYDGPPDPYIQASSGLIAMELGGAQIVAALGLITGVDTVPHPEECRPWMDSSVCGPWVAFKGEAYQMQTAASEIGALGPGWRSLLAPEVQYGQMPIVILATEKEAKGSPDSFADTLRRTANGRLQIVPGDFSALLEESPQSIVDTVKSLLH